MQAKQKLILLFLLLCWSPNLRAQPYVKLVHKTGEVPVFDAPSNASNTFEVARYANSQLNFPCAVQTGVNAREILAAYIKSDTTRSIEMARSKDGGRTWKKEIFRNQWDDEIFRSLSMFNLGTPHIATSTRKERRAVQSKTNLMLFSGGSPILISSSYTNGEQWCHFYPANNLGGFRISGMIQLKNGKHMALFHDDGRFLYPDRESGNPVLRKSAIYKIYSSDGGLTWSPPQVALKHNLKELYDATVFYSPAKHDNTLIMIASERETSTTYVSMSDDHGKTWSYPEPLPPFIQGDRFGIASYKRQMVVVFRDMSKTLNDGTPNPTFGDLVVWTGDLKELVKGNKNGIKIRISDNYPTDKAVDYNDRKFYDCGYASVVSNSKKEVCVIAYGRWDADELPYIRSFVFNPIEIRKQTKNMLN